MMGGRLPMTQRFAGSIFALAVVVLPAIGQTSASVAKPAPAAKTVKTWVPPKTPDGQPDLSGLWTNVTITPMERPPDLAGKEFFTPKESVEWEKDARNVRNKDRRAGSTDGDLGRA